MFLSCVVSGHQTATVKSFYIYTIEFYLVILSLQFNEMSLCLSSHVCLSVCLSQMSNHSSDPEEEI